MGIRADSKAAYDAAKSAGEKTYISPRPCAKGHVVRRTSNRTCIECEIEWKKKIGFNSYQRNMHSKRQAKKFGAEREKPDSCECCGTKDFGKHGLCADHDHITGKFRGWICKKCNSGIGQLGDDLEGVLRAVKYLEKCRDG